MISGVFKLWQEKIVWFLWVIEIVHNESLWSIIFHLLRYSSEQDRWILSIIAIYFYICAYNFFTVLIYLHWLHCQHVACVVKMYHTFWLVWHTVCNDSVDVCMYFRRPCASLQVFREDGIMSGYRHPRSSAVDCILSSFQMTNETVNIWTHFLPTW